MTAICRGKIIDTADDLVKPQQCCTLAMLHCVHWIRCVSHCSIFQMYLLFLAPLCLHSVPFSHVGLLQFLRIKPCATPLLWILSQPVLLQRIMCPWEDGLQEKPWELLNMLNKVKLRPDCTEIFCIVTGLKLRMIPSKCHYFKQVDTLVMPKMFLR